MPANLDPIYPKTPVIGWDSVITAALNAANIAGGVLGTDIALIFTAGANGAYVSDIVAKPAPGTNTAATVLRAWLNNGATTGTAANSVLLGELTIPATTTSATLAQPDFVLAIRRAIPATYRIYYSLATDPGATNFAVSCHGADY